MSLLWLQFLDPHTTQKCGTVGEKQNQAEVDFDTTYHQKYVSRIPFEKMDPSLALVWMALLFTRFCCCSSSEV